MEERFAEALLIIINAPVGLMIEALEPLPNDQSDYDIAKEIKLNDLEGDPESVQLTKSRRGQGIFKANVRLIEDHCRITGVTNIEHLRASQVKLWGPLAKKKNLAALMVSYFPPM